MLKLFASILKATIFAVIILILGNWVQWDGKTVSDQIRSRMAAPTRANPIPNPIQGTLDRTMHQVRSWGDRLSTPSPSRRQARAELTKTRKDRSAGEIDRISPAEREKLRSLFEEARARKD